MTQIQADLVAPKDALHFYDVRGVDMPRALTALEAWNIAMRQPLPGLSLAFRLRDAVSALFGVARIGGFSGKQVAAPKVGDHLDFFLIERIEPRMLTLSSRDRHLDVLTCITTHDQRLTVTSSVKVHNTFGRLYMIPVAPAHRLLTTVMLRRAKRAMAAAQLPPSDGADDDR